jgi:ATP-binding cassette, subfamily B, bacterial PglK
MNFLKKILYFLTSHEKKRAILLLTMVLMMALIDMIGIASIMPFIAVLTNPSIIETNSILNYVFQASYIIGIENHTDFIFTLGIVVFGFLVFSLSFKALTTYVQLHFIQIIEYTIGKRLMESYLHQPYSWFLNRNSADLGKSIISEVGFVVGQALSPTLILISQSIVSVFLIVLLILVNLKLTLIITLIIALAYWLIFKGSSSFLNKIGTERVKANLMRFKVINEAFGASKEVKFGRLEKNFIQKFSKNAKLFAKHQASSSIIGQLPRYFIEVIAFGGMILVMLYIIAQTGSFVNAIPTISLFAFAGYRLMPSVQQIYAATTTIKFSKPAIDKLYDDFNSLNKYTTNQSKDIIKFNKTIILNNISYNYPNSSKTALKNFNLTIPVKKTVGIVGTTGSGKTTTVDIILGLLEPQKGSLIVDDLAITDTNCGSWQRLIGYVPQHIYLTDDTIAANIAFGVNSKEINQELVDKASKIANLHDFVISELPNKYQTIVGERGIRLSGGQRQRIGIARALYHNPKILIFDEATSALDNHTEKNVMEDINKIYKEQLTIILVAHRINTLKDCDLIYQLEKGEIVRQGTFNELFDIDNQMRSISKN